MEKWPLSVSPEGVHTWAFYDENENALTFSDIQSSQNVKDILDSNAVWRAAENPSGMSPLSQGRKVASLPITVWVNWRRAWQGKYADKWTWSSYLLMMLHKEEYKNFLTTNEPFPTVGARG